MRQSVATACWPVHCYACLHSHVQKVRAALSLGCSQACTLTHAKGRRSGVTAVGGNCLLVCPLLCMPAHACAESRSSVEAGFGGKKRTASLTTATHACTCMRMEGARSVEVTNGGKKRYVPSLVLSPAATCLLSGAVHALIPTFSSSKKAP
eukprot:643899-Pelagomonas_calceolata.AAC.1